MTRPMLGLQPGKGYDLQDHDKGWTSDAVIIKEGHIAVGVTDTEKAAEEIRRIASGLEGHLAKERLQPTGFLSTMVIRLAPARVDDLVAAVTKIGPVRDRFFESRDVSWELEDAGIKLESLRQTLTRYKELLREAADVDQVLAVESEMERVRTEIQRIEGREAWLEDRSALATVEIRLLREVENDREPEASTWPGIRASHMTLLTEGLRPRNFAGAGWSMQSGREFTLDIDILTRLDSLDSVDAALATIGGGTYSAFAGEADRRWLTPHIGYALGYGWVEGRSHFVGLFTIGTEIYRGPKVLVDSGLRWGVLAGRGGPSLGLQPHLSFHLAF